MDKDKDQDKWPENIFNSMKGSQRAKPQSELFAKIESQIASSEVKVLHMLPFKYVAAAAILICLLNTSALLLYTQQNKTQPQGEALQVSDSGALINSFEIYK